jgi:hypothetical protein
MSYDEFNPKQGRTSFPPNGRDHTQWFEYCGQTLSKLQMVKDADYLILGTLICYVTFMYSSNVSTSVSSLTVQYIYIYIPLLGGFLAFSNPVFCPYIRHHDNT